MAFSPVAVIGNSLRLRAVRLQSLPVSSKASRIECAEICDQREDDCNQAKLQSHGQAQVTQRTRLYGGPPNAGYLSS